MYYSYVTVHICMQVIYYIVTYIIDEYSITPIIILLYYSYLT